MKAIVFFFDGEDLETGEFYTLEQALKEDFVIVEDNEIKPLDKCSVVFWYDERLVASWTTGPPIKDKIYKADSASMLDDLELQLGQRLSDDDFDSIAATAIF